MPRKVEGSPPGIPNIFTDGAVKCPAYRNWAIGGCGIWAPDGLGAVTLSECAEAFLHKERWEAGTAWWAPLLGPWHTSTRAELAGLSLAMSSTQPINIGVDNKAVVDKANMLIDRAKQLDAQGKLGTSRPTKKSPAPLTQASVQ